jgi:BD-FAE
MLNARPLAALALASLLAACSDGNDHRAAPPEPEVVERPSLELSFSDAPIALDGITADFASDLRYGEAERNLFDIYLPDCSDPTPLVIYIHGGGFTGGDKAGSHDSNADNIREFLQNCVAFATINYTLLSIPADDANLAEEPDQGGVLTSLQDTARALQFMRYYFESLNLDAENVALYGVSAGAGASLWLGTHDDMADAGNEDPVLQESTRVKAVGALATQATYDLIDWEPILLPITEPFAEVLGGTDIPTLAAAVGAGNYLLTFLGITSLDDLDTQEQLDYRANVDMLELMDSGDAPIFTRNFETSLADLMNVFLHHALHALAVKERADEVGLESVAYSDDPAYPLEDPSGETLSSFLIRHIR